MRETLRDNLRGAWHGILTVAEVASREGVHVRRIRRFWEAEKREGRLPEGPRPHFIEAAPREVQAAIAVAVADAEDAADFTVDDAPIGGPLGLAIPPGDPLLVALRNIHGAERWREVDGMPVRILNDEAAGRVISRWRAAQLASIRDAFVSALMLLSSQRQSTTRKAAA